MKSDQSASRKSHEPAATAPQWRDRICELRRVPAAALAPHPLNWRTHPPEQRRALAGVLAEIGYADALLARELPDGSLELIDGHLRRELTPDALVPVLVLDVNEREAALLLATLDPLANMADANAETFSKLLDGVQTAHQDVAAMVSDLAAMHGVLDDADETSGELEAPETYLVQTECADEAAQRALYERLQAEGYRCRLLTV